MTHPTLKEINARLVDENLELRQEVAELEAELAALKDTLRESPFMVTEWKQRAEKAEAEGRAEKQAHERTTYLLGALSIWAKGLNGTAEDALSAARRDWTARAEEGSGHE